MPRAVIQPGKYYHIYNRGINKQVIFNNRKDYMRMLFYLLFFQSPQPIYNISELAPKLLSNNIMTIHDDYVQKVISSRTVLLHMFSLMQNHLHIMAEELVEGGMSMYLKRAEIAYTKYYNTKYERSGYLFQGPYQSIHIGNNEQLLYLSAYIHLNIKDAKQWKGRENSYPWSSYQDYVDSNRWGALLNRELILSQFGSKFATEIEYKRYVESNQDSI